LGCHISQKFPLVDCCVFSSIPGSRVFDLIIGGFAFSVCDNVSCSCVYKVVYIHYKKFHWASSTSPHSSSDIRAIFNRFLSPLVEDSIKSVGVYSPHATILFVPIGRCGATKKRKYFVFSLLKN
jgi:hypothetical protein